MNKSRMTFLLMIVTFFLLPIIAEAADVLQVFGPQHAGKVNFRSLDQNRLLVSVLDQEGNAITGLTPKDFRIAQGQKNGIILSVEPLEEYEDLGVNIIFVVDNSFSMEERKAVNPLLKAVENFLKTVRPIDNVYMVAFADPGVPSRSKQKQETTWVINSSDVSTLNSFLKSNFTEGITRGTYLKNAMMKGVEIAQKMPENSHKFLVVFSDGEDLNSTVKAKDLSLAANQLKNFSVFSVDYMNNPKLDKFLKAFSEDNRGSIRKAEQATDFLSIFKEYSQIIYQRYLVTYRFRNPPLGTIVLAPSQITIEEVTTVDSSPLLNYIYFSAGADEIHSRYARLANASEAISFDEKELRGTLSKYRQMLNVIGKRLTVNQEATITIVGCNSTLGMESKKLSQRRAEAVYSYLNDVWGIDSARMKIVARNLPELQSNNSDPKGIEENQRVEINSDYPAILDTIQSTYIQALSDTKEIFIHPSIQSEAGIKEWRVTLSWDGQRIKTVTGQTEIPSSLSFEASSLGKERISQLSEISATFEMTDNEGNVFTTMADRPIKIKFVKREDQLAQKNEYKVRERYGLILFGFDKSDINGRNTIIANRITKRIKELPYAVTQITGHTDIIGTQEYNMKLSMRRATRVFKHLQDAGLSANEQISYEGMGPHDPPYDNNQPEGRAFNRTVIVTIDYDKKD